MLTEFVVIMQPFADATDETQGNNIVTSSKVIPSVRGLQRHLDRVIELPHADVRAASKKRGHTSCALPKAQGINQNHAVMKQNDHFFLSSRLIYK